MAQALRAIVLNATKTGERSIVIHTLSAEWGRRSFICTVGKSSPMALFLPFGILDFEVVENTRSELWRIRNVCAAYPLGGIRSDVRKNAMVMFMSEVLYRSVRDGNGGADLFEWCRNSILTLDSLTRDFSNYHLRFLLEYASVLGFSPSEDALLPFAGENSGRISELLALDFSEFLLYPLTGMQRAEIASSILRYLSFHTESEINVKSLAVLSELFR